MQPANSLSDVFEDVLLIPSYPNGEIDRSRLQKLGYRYLSIHSARFHAPMGQTAYAKPRPEFKEFVLYYEDFGGCYFNLFAVENKTVVYCQADQIISSRRVAEIAVITDLGIVVDTQPAKPAAASPAQATGDISLPAPPPPPRRQKAKDARPSAAGAVKRLDNFTRQVLSTATAEGNVLKLSGQLTSEDYERINAVLIKMGGRWNRGKGGHVFPFPVSDLLETAIASSTFVDRKQDLQLFETPLDRCEAMVDQLEITPGDLALEPSAGTGRLVSALKRRGAIVTAVEIDPTNADSLKGKCDELHVGDFLAFAEQCQQRFHVIAMNPPFTRGQDMAHVLAAFDLLAPGGRLVAIVSESVFVRDSRDALQFRAWLQRSGASIEAIGAGTFAKSGTAAKTRMIALSAPAVAVTKRAPAPVDCGPLFEWAGSGATATHPA
jgi:predicted RNA methylase